MESKSHERGECVKSSLFGVQAEVCNLISANYQLPPEGRTTNIFSHSLAGGGFIVHPTYSIRELGEQGIWEAKF